MPDTPEPADEHHHHELTYYVNNESAHTEHHELKVKTILENAELKPFDEWELTRDQPLRKFTDYDEEVHLHGGERFTATQRERHYEIIVNTREKTVTSDELSFEQVLQLRYEPDPVPSGPNWEFTVGYRHTAQEPHKGSLLAGQSVKIKNGTVFHVTATDKS